jgi:membrane protein implicated in regulation of membrane protease activity
MSATLQTIVALVIVALTATWLVRRAFARRKNPGCGGNCGCPTTEIKAKLRAGLPPV